MNKLSLMLVSAVAFGLIGCGSSDDDSAMGSTDGLTAGETEVATATAGMQVDGATTAGPAAPEATTTAGSPADGNTAGSSTDGGNASTGENPGLIPDPILGEVTSIDLSTATGPAGYKIFSGDQVVFNPDVPGDLALFAENSYINLEFSCTGELDNIEIFPRPMPAFTAEDYGGIFSWVPADPEDESGQVDLTLNTVTFGDPDNVDARFDIGSIVNGSLIVGTGVIENLFVTRIVQFEVCN